VPPFGQRPPTAHKSPLDAGLRAFQLGLNSAQKDGATPRYRAGATPSAFFPDVTSPPAASLSRWPFRNNAGRVGHCLRRGCPAAAL